MPKVKLEIVGMFFVEEVEVELDEQGMASVKDVLVAARAKFDGSNGTRFAFSSDGAFLDGFAITYDSPPKSRSGHTYDPGTYGFNDPFFGEDSRGVPVWQYYVEDPSGAQQYHVEDPSGAQQSDDSCGKFTAFSEARFPFADHWSVTWRCVLIFTAPIAPPSSSSRLKKSAKA